MRTKVFLSGLLVTLLTAITCEAQKDIRLYHEAWYTENVSKSPQKALKLYAQLCRDFPDSPLCRFALARHAGLLMQLNQPEKARALLLKLKKLGFSPANQKDKEALDRAMRNLAMRNKLFGKIRKLKSRHKELENKLAALKKNGTKAESIQLAKDLKQLEKALNDLRLSLENTTPKVLHVKRRIMEKGLSSHEAKKHMEHIAQLNDRVKALKEEGQLKEAAKVKAEAKREEANFQRRYHRKRIHSPKHYSERFSTWLKTTPLSEATRVATSKPYVRILLFGLITSPDLMKRLPPEEQKKVFSIMDVVIREKALSLEKNGHSKSSQKLVTTWNQVQTLIKKGSFRQARTPMKTLISFFKYKKGRRPNRRTRPPREKGRRSL